jgi:hypothetical protein
MSDANPLGAFALFLQARYRADGGGDALQLRFEPLGHPITEADVVDESLAALADQYPRTDDGPFVAATTRLSSVYRRLLPQATAIPGPDPAFDSMKKEALTRLEDSQRAPFGPVPIAYLAASANPARWFSDERYWIDFDSGAALDGPTALGKPTAALARPLLSGALARELPTPNQRPAAPSAPPMLPLSWTLPADTPSLVASARVPRVQDAAPLLGTRGIGLAHVAAASPAVAPALDQRMALTRALGQAAMAMPATSAPRLRLRYCVVGLQRPWLETSLLLLYRHWMVPGLGAGEMAATPACFRQFPVAMVVVRDFSAEAKWNSSDTARLTASAGLGPFSLMGADWSPSEGRLSNPGVQIVGWLCSPLPPLPPGADPALKPQVRPFVAVAQDGWYIARFELHWLEPGAGGVTVVRQWASSAVPKGFSAHIEMAPDASQVHVRAWALGGGVLCDRVLPAPDGLCYRVTGTTLQPGLVVVPPD